MGLAFRWACFLLLLLTVVYPTTTLLSNDASTDPAFEHFQDHAPSHPEVQRIDLRPSHSKQVANGNLFVQHLPRHDSAVLPHTPECYKYPEQCHHRIEQRESDSPDPDYHGHLPRDGSAAPPHTTAWWCEQNPEACQQHIHQRESGSPGPDYHEYCRYHPGLQMCQSGSIEQRQPISLPHECVTHPELQACNTLSLQQRQSIGVPHYCLYHTELPECNPRIERRTLPVSWICQEHPELPTCHSLSLQQRQSPHECVLGSTSPVCHGRIKERDSDFHDLLEGFCRRNPDDPACHTAVVTAREPVTDALHIYYGVVNRYCKKHREDPACRCGLHPEFRWCKKPFEQRRTEDSCAHDPESCRPSKAIKRDERSCAKIFGIFWWSSCNNKGGPLPTIDEDTVENNDWDNTEDEYEELYEDWYIERLMELVEQEWQDFQDWLLEYGGDADFEGFEEKLTERSDTHMPDLTTSDTPLLEPEHTENLVSRLPPRPTHSPRPPKGFSARMVPIFPKPRPVKPGPKNPHTKPPMKDAGESVGSKLNSPVLQIRGRKKPDPNDKPKPYNSPLNPPGPPVRPKPRPNKPPVKEEGAITRHRSVAQLSLATPLIPSGIAHLVKAEFEDTTKINDPGNNSTQKPVSAALTKAERDKFTEILLYVLLGLICFGILSLAVFIAARRFMKKYSWTPREDCSGPLTPTKFSSGSGATAGGREAYGSTTREDEETQRPMMERSSGTGLDGVNDGWTKWIQHRRGAEIHVQKRASPTPRIPSLTLPKPTFATVRKVSGLPDLDGATAQKTRPRASEKRLSKAVWTSTV